MPSKLESFIAHARSKGMDHQTIRMLLLSSGWKEKDYDEYGYDFGTVGSRLDDLAGALPRIKSRLAKLNPAPTREIPILIGGQGEKKTLRLVAQYADACNIFDSPELGHKLQVLREHCEREGRDYAEIELLRDALRAEVPVLGLCWGGQALAVAMGLWPRMNEYR